MLYFAPSRLSASSGFSAAGQWKHLRRYLTQTVLPYSPYYADKATSWPEAARAPQSLTDFQRIPFTTKTDLVDAVAAKRIRDFVLQPDPEHIRRKPAVIWDAVRHGRTTARQHVEQEFRPVMMTSTTGRSAAPVPFFYTRYDLNNLARSGITLCETFDTHSDDRIVNVFPYAPHLAFWQVTFATMAFTVFHIGTGGGKTMGTHGNLQLINTVQPTALVGMPTFLYHLLHLAEEQGLQFTQLRNVILGGEKAPQGLRKKLKELLAAVGSPDARIMATYGFTEARMAWAECPSTDGTTPTGYHLPPGLAHVEIIDPQTGEVLPEGHPGEIVFTPLDGRGIVVLRYRTGDRINGGLVTGTCPHCGRMSQRLVGKISRVSEQRALQLDKLKGTLVDFNTLEHLLDDQPDVGSWCVELRKANDDPHELDELILHVQARSLNGHKTLARTLERRCRSLLEISPNHVAFHSPEAMRKLLGVGTELKEKRLIDNRPKAPVTQEESS